MCLGGGQVGIKEGQSLYLDGEQVGRKGGHECVFGW